MPIAISIPHGQLHSMATGGGTSQEDAEIVCKIIVEKCIKAKASNPKGNNRVPRGFAKKLFEYYQPKFPLLTMIMISNGIARYKDKTVEDTYSVQTPFPQAKESTQSQTKKSNSPQNVCGEDVTQSSSVTKRTMGPKESKIAAIYERRKQKYKEMVNENDVPPSLQANGVTQSQAKSTSSETVCDSSSAEKKVGGRSKETSIGPSRNISRQKSLPTNSLNSQQLPMRAEFMLPDPEKEAFRALVNSICVICVQRRAIRDDDIQEMVDKYKPRWPMLNKELIRSAIRTDTLLNSAVGHQITPPKSDKIAAQNDAEVRKKKSSNNRKRSWSQPAKALCSQEGCNRCAQNGAVCLIHSQNTKRIKKFCSHEGCNNWVQNKGVCVQHGATVKTCSNEGCTNIVISKGVCIKHGAKARKRCSHEGCTNQAQRGGVCVKHGARSAVISKQKEGSMIGAMTGSTEEQDAPPWHEA